MTGRCSGAPLQRTVARADGSVRDLLEWVKSETSGYYKDTCLIFE